jgi:hypothetical protein
MLDTYSQNVELMFSSNFVASPTDLIRLTGRMGGGLLMSSTAWPTSPKYSNIGLGVRG